MVVLAKYHQDVGYDAGKKIHGRKRHLSVDLLGLVLRVLVTSASLPERHGAKQVLQRVHDTGHQVKRLHTIWMDGGYRGEEFMRLVMDMCSVDCGNCSSTPREERFCSFT